MRRVVLATIALSACGPGRADVGAFAPSATIGGRGALRGLAIDSDGRVAVLASDAPSELAVHAWSPAGESQWETQLGQREDTARKRIAIDDRVWVALSPPPATTRTYDDPPFEPGDKVYISLDRSGGVVCERRLPLLKGRCGFHVETTCLRGWVDSIAATPGGGAVVVGATVVDKGDRPRPLATWLGPGCEVLSEHVAELGTTGVTADGIVSQFEPSSVGTADGEAVLHGESRREDVLSRVASDGLVAWTRALDDPEPSRTDVDHVAAHGDLTAYLAYEEVTVMQADQVLASGLAAPACPSPDAVVLVGETVVVADAEKDEGLSVCAIELDGTVAWAESIREFDRSSVANLASDGEAWIAVGSNAPDTYEVRTFKASG